MPTHEHGRAIAGKPGGDHRSSKSDILTVRNSAMLANNHDITLAAIQFGHAARDGAVRIGTFLRFYDLRGNTREKTGRVIEQRRTDILHQRRARGTGRLALEPERFNVDESRA